MVLLSRNSRGGATINDSSDPLDPAIDMILRKLDERKISRFQLAARAFVSYGKMNDVLNKKRPMTIRLLSKLCCAIGLRVRVEIEPVTQA